MEAEYCDKHTREHEYWSEYNDDNKFSEQCYREDMSGTGPSTLHISCVHREIILPVGVLSSHL